MSSWNTDHRYASVSSILRTPASEIRRGIWPPPSISSLGWRHAGVMTQPLVDYFLLGYRRAGGPGRLYPAIQAVRALATAMWVADLPQESTGAEHVEAGLAFWLDQIRRG